jgi:hypothetical protein
VLRNIGIASRSEHSEQPFQPSLHICQLVRVAGAFCQDQHLARSPDRHAGPMNGRSAARLDGHAASSNSATLENLHQRSLRVTATSEAPPILVVSNTSRRVSPDGGTRRAASFSWGVVPGAIGTR